MHLPVPALHLPAPRTPHLSALHPPTPDLTRLPVATVLLTVLYAVALVVALTAPGQHALAGCAVLAGLVGRSVVRRRRPVAAPVAVHPVAVHPVAEAPATAA